MKRCAASRRLIGSGEDFVLDGRCGKGRCGPAAALRCGGRALGARLPCAAQPCGPRRGTRSARCARSAQTIAPGQKWMRVSTRAGHKACAARRRICAPRPARTTLCTTARCLWGGMPPLCREAAGGSLAGRMGGAEQRRVGVGACTHALPRLTREHCLSGTSAASEASCERDPDLSSAGQSGPQGPTAADKPRRAHARGLARATRRTNQRGD